MLVYFCVDLSVPDYIPGVTSVNGAVDISEGQTNNLL